MSAVPTCPACATPLALFTPRESNAHVNACLDAQGASPRPSTPLRCAVCARDLTALTPAARVEHANRCVDSTLPLGQEPVPARRPRAAPQRLPPKPVDERVRRLLELLGLARYTQRFADEEIDMEALRLLGDSDFTQLKIPEAARRRIAEALHSVHALGGEEEEKVDEQVIVQTQQFGESRLGRTMRRGSPLFGDDSDGDSGFQCSPAIVPKNVKNETIAHAADLDGARNLDGDVRKRENEIFPPFLAEVPRGARLGAVERRAMIASQVDSDDELSDVSSLRDLENEMRLTSQISLHAKLERWRDRQVKRELCRHKREMEGIQTRYEQMQKRICSTRVDSTVGAEHQGKNAGRIDEKRDSESLDGACVRSPQIMTNAAEVYDLTRDVSDDDGIRQLHCAPHAAEDLLAPVRAEETIEISSASGPRKGSRRSFLAGNDALPTISPLHSVNDLGTHTTRQRESQLFKSSDEEGGEKSEEEVMDLVDAEWESCDVLSGLNSTHNIGPTAVEDRADGTLDSNELRDETETASTGARPPSRLKKVRKVTRAEVVEAIRSNSSLYDDILVMETVRFARVLEAVRAGGISVSKKSLTDILQREGISFKPEPPSKGEHATKYFNRLNREFD